MARKDTLTVSTEAFLTALFLVKDYFKDKGYDIAITRGDITFPDTLAMLSIKNATQSLYIRFNTRFSNSAREYVLKSFDLVSYKDPKVKNLFPSTDYTSMIHEPKEFIRQVVIDTGILIDLARIELGIPVKK